MLSESADFIKLVEQRNKMKKNFVALVLLSIFICVLSPFLMAEESVVPAKILPRIVDFGSHQCKACKAMDPILESLKKNYAGKFKTEFVDVWVKENQQQAKENKIETIPTQIFFASDGKELFRNTGVFTEEDILNKWSELGYEFPANGTDSSKKKELGKNKNQSEEK